MKYIAVKHLEKYLIALEKLDIIQTSKANSYLRICYSEILENGIKKYVIDNGSGDHLLIYIDGNTALIKGFDHENNLSPYGKDEWDISFFDKVYADAPEKFIGMFIGEEKDETTFAMWNISGDENWILNSVDPKEDGGIDFLLGYIHKTSESLLDWACDYYESEFSLDLIEVIFNNGKISKDIIIKLNSNRDVEEALLELAKFGAQ